MTKKEGVIYFKMVVSYGEPTEFDAVGCDGMYVRSIEKTDDVANLENELLQYKADLKATDEQVAELEAWNEIIFKLLPPDTVLWLRSKLDALKEGDDVT